MRKKRTRAARDGAAGEPRCEELGAALLVVDRDDRVLAAPGWKRAIGMEPPERLTADGEDDLVREVATALEDCRRSRAPVRRLARVALDRMRYYAVSAARVRTDTAGERRAALVQEITGTWEIGQHEGDALRQLAHDLRTPLTSAQGAIELLQAGRVGKVSVDQARLLAMLQESLEMMLALVEDASARARSAAPPAAGRRAAI